MCVVCFRYHDASTSEVQSTVQPATRKKRVRRSNSIDKLVTPSDVFTFFYRRRARSFRLRLAGFRFCRRHPHSLSCEPLGLETLAVVRKCILCEFVLSDCLFGIDLAKRLTRVALCFADRLGWFTLRPGHFLRLQAQLHNPVYYFRMIQTIIAIAPPPRTKTRLGLYFEAEHVNLSSCRHWLRCALLGLHGSRFCHPRLLRISAIDRAAFLSAERGPQRARRLAQRSSLELASP